MCPVCGHTDLMRTVDRYCTVQEEVEISPEGVRLRSRSIVAVSPASSPARMECPRCGHAWWEKEGAHAIPLPATVTA
jgi:C4-type Zn-finger protein